MTTGITMGELAELINRMIADNPDSANESVVMPSAGPVSGIRIAGSNRQPWVEITTNEQW